MIRNYQTIREEKRRQKRIRQARRRSSPRKGIPKKTESDPVETVNKIITEIMEQTIGNTKMMMIIIEVGL